MVRNRKKLMQEMRHIQSLSYEPFQYRTAAQYEAAPHIRWMAHEVSPARISFVRSWLGDEAVQEVWYFEHWQGFSTEKLQRLKRAFPEAEFEAGEPPLPQPRDE